MSHARNHRQYLPRVLLHKERQLCVRGTTARKKTSDAGSPYDKQKSYEYKGIMMQGIPDTSERTPALPSPPRQMSTPVRTRSSVSSQVERHISSDINPRILVRRLSSSPSMEDALSCVVWFVCKNVQALSREMKHVRQHLFRVLRSVL